MSSLSIIDPESNRQLDFNELVERFARHYGVSETDITEYVDKLCGTFDLQWEVIAFANVDEGDWREALDAGALEWDL